MFSARKIAVVVPIGTYDDSYRYLLEDLEAASFRGEVILVFSKKALLEPSKALKDLYSRETSLAIRVVLQSGSRAEKMNAGSLYAKQPFLWFLHADTRLSPRAVTALCEQLETYPERLHYFALRFKEEGLKFMRINEFGVMLRSRFLGMPFGDQGFCLSKEGFSRASCYPLGAPYGEDHLFVWRWRQLGHKIHPVPCAIFTSPRKYRDGGWGKTTLDHLYKTYVQAAPEALTLGRRKLRRSLWKLSKSP